MRDYLKYLQNQVTQRSPNQRKDHEGLGGGPTKNQKHPWLTKARKAEHSRPTHVRGGKEKKIQETHLKLLIHIYNHKDTLYCPKFISEYLLNTKNNKRNMSQRRKHKRNNKHR